jgi:phosphatidylserine/phosphatidylglycerophosphate/cardiolipin synthase-like enzyme
MLRLLAERLRAGVAVRIIGHVGKSIGRSSSQMARRFDAHVNKHLDGRTYEPTHSDSDSTRGHGRMSRLVEEGVRAGLRFRGIKEADNRADLHVEKLHHRRLHLRAIVRDGTVAFVGSQSLRKAELDTRRELGVFVHDPDIVRKIHETFERDWPSDIPGAVELAEHVNASPRDNGAGSPA